jgi:predicted flap endonuclease-1-like 5' DNA nuclease
VAAFGHGWDGKDPAMNWPFGGGWVITVLGLVCAALAVGWWRDHRSAESLRCQIRLRAEAETDRLRLRISALKPVESRAADLATELAGLRPIAARVPELEEQMTGLRSELAEANRSIIELEREAATLRSRAEEADELELEVASGASRAVELERELTAVRERTSELERTTAALETAAGEVERLNARLEASAAKERDMVRELGALGEAVNQRDAAATLAEARAEAAETLIARRDEIILTLEQRLADRSLAMVPGGAGSQDGDDGERDDVVEDETSGAALGDLGSRRSSGTASLDEIGATKPTKAERKKAKRAKKAKKAKRSKRPATMESAPGSANGPGAAAAAELEPEPTPEPAPALRLVEPGAGTDPVDVQPDRDGAAPSGDATDETIDLRAAPQDGHRDDLQLISGIGPVMERRLNEMGVHTWEQLATLGERDADRLTAELPGISGRVKREGWVEQAVELVARHPLTEPYDRPGRRSVAGRE